MPCSQMISMNISPPRLSEASRLAVTPALKARILKSCRRNMGSATLVSMRQKMPSSSTPPIRQQSTSGLVQPMVWLP